MSSVLDEERREAFLQALQSLQEEQVEHERQEKEETQRQEDMLRRDIEMAKKARAENEERERRRLEEERAKREGASEVDYGVEETPSVAGSNKPRQPQPRTSSDSNRSARPPRSSLSKANSKAIAPLTITAQASIVMTRLRGIINQLAASLNANPMLLMRLLAFVMGFLIMVGNKAVRERVQRVVGASWGKIKATAGMGTKVSYI